MQLEKLVNQVSRLPAAKQQEVADFVAFLEARYALNDDANLVDEWSDQSFKDLSLKQVVQDQQEEADLYSDTDLKERWS